MRIPENSPAVVFSASPKISSLVDFERCEDMTQLHNVMEVINRNQYALISVTQDSKDIFTVFFRRCVIG